MLSHFEKTSRVLLYFLFLDCDKMKIGKIIAVKDILKRIKRKVENKAKLSPNSKLQLMFVFSGLVAYATGLAAYFRNTTLFLLGIFTEFCTLMSILYKSMMIVRWGNE